MLGYVLARAWPAAPVMSGERLSFRLVRRRVFPYGLGLAFGGYRVAIVSFSVEAVGL